MESPLILLKNILFWGVSMKIKSLGLKTDIFISSLECEMYEHENYVYMKTPSRPDFYWGNFLITQSNIDSKISVDT